MQSTWAPNLLSPFDQSSTADDGRRRLPRVGAQLPAKAPIDRLRLHAIGRDGDSRLHIAGVLEEHRLYRGMAREGRGLNRKCLGGTVAGTSRFGRTSFIVQRKRQPVGQAGMGSPRPGPPGGPVVRTALSTPHGENT